MREVRSWLSPWWADMSMSLWIPQASFLWRHDSRVEATSKWLLITWAYFLVLCVSLFLTPLVSTQLLQFSGHPILWVMGTIYWASASDESPAARMKSSGSFLSLKINSSRLLFIFWNKFTYHKLAEQLHHIIITTFINEWDGFGFKLIILHLWWLQSCTSWLLS